MPVVVKIQKDFGNGYLLGVGRFQNTELKQDFPVNILLKGDKQSGFHLTVNSQVAKGTIDGKEILAVPSSPVAYPGENGEMTFNKVFIVKKDK